MRRIFEFGEYWHIGTLFLYFTIGFAVSMLARKGAICSQSKADSNRYCVCKIKKSDIYYIGIFVIFSFFYTFRSSVVGADTPYYVRHFQEIKSITFDFQRFLVFKQDEPLFDLLTLIINRITKNYTVYFLVISWIISYSYVKFIRTFWTKDTMAIFLNAIVIGYQYSMNAMRSAIASSFLILSICALKERHVKKAVILTLIGSMFHYTVAINLAFIMFEQIIRRKKDIKKPRVYLTVLLVPVFLFAVLPYMINFLARTRYRAYINTGTPSIIGQWDIILVCMVALLALEKGKDYDERLRVSLSASFFCFLLIIPAIFLGAYRLTGYYELSRLFVCDYVLGRIPISNKAVWKAIMFIFTLLYIVFKLGRNSMHPGFQYFLIPFGGLK